MASTLNAALCALLAVAFWSLTGFALGRRALPRTLATGMAPVLGWAVHSAAMLPVYLLVGFTAATIVPSGAICAAAAIGSFLVWPMERRQDDPAVVPVGAIVAAAILALLPAVALIPKFSGDAVLLADPIFDHAKSAVIDAIARQGVPPVNPVFGAAPHRLVYYYLWHFSAAELAATLKTSGWEADIGLTWFTAMAALVLMMGLAVTLGRKGSAAFWVVALAAATSLWEVIGHVVSLDDLTPYLWPPIGMGGWLFQATWVPQHAMAACCAVTAVVLIVALAHRATPYLAALLALTVAAGFESSTYVGGVTFAIAAAGTLPFALRSATPGSRLRFFAVLAAAALVTAALVLPFVIDQIALVKTRGGAAPVVVNPYAVFGEFLPYWQRRLLDLPGYWLLILPIELPACFLSGSLALIFILRGKLLQNKDKDLLIGLACVAAAGLAASWSLTSTLGENNDLGLRAIIPAEIALIVAAAVGASALRSKAVILAASAGLLLSLPDTAAMIHDNIAGTRRPGAEIFARSAAAWQAVRRLTAPSARIANNPRFLAEMTPWPVNISWALLSNRNSCFAGREMALAFAPLPPPRREEIDTQFVRVFAGEGTRADIADLAEVYGCDAVLLVPSDGAWNRDPFAESPLYRLAEDQAGSWRIYLRVR
jgi:hypothetical protein